MDPFITIATFQYPHEAYVIQSKLESEGIIVFLKDELTIQAHNFLSNAAGGVKMQIQASDLEAALPILEHAGIIMKDADIPSSLEIKINDFTSPIPFVNRWPYEFKVITIIFIPLVVTLLIFVVFDLF